MTSKVLRHCVGTSIGFFEVTIHEYAVQSIKFLSKSSDHKDQHPLIGVVKTQLEEYIAGDRHTFDFPVNPEGTPFQKRVWEAARAIPYGTTRTYGDLAQKIGKPLAARAVGGALNKNPLLLVIPCHRIVGSTGSMTGFACGIRMKESLLSLERSVAVKQAVFMNVQ